MPIKGYILRRRDIDSHPELPIDPDLEQPNRWRWPPQFHGYLLASVFIGGCGGAYARYAVDSALPTTASGWPIATLFVNLLGAFTLGLLLEALTRIGKDKGLTRTVRLMVGTGFIGAFTTYSTFSLDVHTLLLAHQFTIALTYAAFTVIGGVLLGALGVQTASRHHARRMARL